MTFGVAALAEPTSVYVARTGLTFRASVNGRFVDETGDANSPTVNIASYRSTPSFRVPVEFLHVGSEHADTRAVRARRVALPPTGNSLCRPGGAGREAGVSPLAGVSRRADGHGCHPVRDRTGLSGTVERAARPGSVHAAGVRLPALGGADPALSVADAAAAGTALGRVHDGAVRLVACAAGRVLPALRVSAVPFHGTVRGGDRGGCRAGAVPGRRLRLGPAGVDWRAAVRADLHRNRTGGRAALRARAAHQDRLCLVRGGFDWRLRGDLRLRPVALSGLRPRADPESVFRRRRGAVHRMDAAGALSQGLCRLRVAQPGSRAAGRPGQRGTASTARAGRVGARGRRAGQRCQVALLRGRQPRSAPAPALAGPVCQRPAGCGRNVRRPRPGGPHRRLHRCTRPAVRRVARRVATGRWRGRGAPRQPGPAASVRSAGNRVRGRSGGKGSATALRSDGAGRQLGSDPARARTYESGVQRAALHAARGRAGRCAPARAAGAGAGLGHRRRHSGRPARADLRRVLPDRKSGARPAQGARTRAGHRASTHGPAGPSADVSLGRRSWFVL